MSLKIYKEKSMNKKKAQLIAKILQCKNEADNLKPNTGKCESIMKLYNKKIIEKAVLTKELEDFEKNFVLRIVKKLTPKTETLIQDYFG